MEISNKIVIENQKQGNPESEWGLSGAGSTDIEGYAADISYNIGDTVEFKIDTDAADYSIDIYRLGYYNGDGARKVATIEHDGLINQPDPLKDPSTGLVDAGNWQITDSWDMPDDLVSGVYIAKLVRQDGIEGENHIPFIIRDDDGQSDVVFQTSDTTWQAYNPWGQANLYDGTTTAVSYNRPMITRDGDPDNPAGWAGSTAANYLFGVEYAAIRWVEANGYDVSYITGVDTARSGSELLEHEIFLSVGHDEYWSPEQRANVEAARDAGVNLAFWSGNEVFWRTRWSPSIDGSEQDFRTFETYKESYLGAVPDPDPEWTGTWRDPEGISEGGGVPENALTGTMYMVDLDIENPYKSIDIPYEFSQFNFWRDTDIANLQPGETWSLPTYLGYEWNVDADNGFRPAGLIHLSSTTTETAGIVDVDFGEYTLPDPPGTATHNLTLYRAESGALVFSAGSIAWAWGLDNTHDLAGIPADVNVQQAMINLFSDMGVQPLTLQTGLVQASQSVDLSAPISTVVSPSTGGQIPAGNDIMISGTASDSGGGTVAVVEVSTDNGASWYRASGTATWEIPWDPQPGLHTLLSRAVDDSVNIESPGTGMQLLVEAPLTANLSIRGSSNNFSMAQGWNSGDTPRTLADIDGDGNLDYVGFGTSAVYALRGTAENTLNGPLPSFDGGFNLVLPDFGLEQGYTQESLRGVDYVGDFTGSSENKFATVWAQAPDGIRYYVATGSVSGIDEAGNEYTTPVYETQSRFYGQFHADEGWASQHTVDNAFVSTVGAGSVPADSYASILGFGDDGLWIGPQAFAPGQTASDTYLVAGSDSFGNFAGWDSTIDIREVRDYSGKEIDLNADGVLDVIGMGQNGLVYAFGEYDSDVYSLGELHTASIDDLGETNFGQEQGWTNNETQRVIADVNNDDHVDIVGFGAQGIWLSLGQTPNADGTGAFAPIYLAFDDYGFEQGWNNTQHVRELGDINGDGALDVVGFSAVETFVATATSDPATNAFTWSFSDIFAEFSNGDGFNLDENFRSLADIDGNGTADIIASGETNTLIATYIS